jgi:chaperonin GroEL
VLETSRNAALSTASSAGDGTTTSVILSNSIANQTDKKTREFPRYSPQKIVRELQALIPFIEQSVNKYKINVDGDNYDQLLLKVATLSANGDEDLGKAILESLDTVGEEGNLTIVEATGSSRYEVERVNGYGIDKGYEESLKNFGPLFINDKSGSMVVLDSPVVLLFDGVVHDLIQIFDACSKIGQVFESKGIAGHGIVLVAHGFSDSVIGDLSVNWGHPGSLAKILPVLTAQNAVSNSATQSLYDLQAYTGSPVFNPMTKPLADIDADAMVGSNKVN